MSLHIKTEDEEDEDIKQYKQDMIEAFYGEQNSNKKLNIAKEIIERGIIFAPGFIKEVKKFIDSYKNDMIEAFYGEQNSNKKLNIAKEIIERGIIFAPGFIKEVKKFIDSYKNDKALSQPVGVSQQYAVPLSRSDDYDEELSQPVFGVSQQYALKSSYSDDGARASSRPVGVSQQYALSRSADYEEELSQPLSGITEISSFKKPINKNITSSGDDIYLGDVSSDYSDDSQTVITNSSGQTVITNSSGQTVITNSSDASAKVKEETLNEANEIALSTDAELAEYQEIFDLVKGSSSFITFANNICGGLKFIEKAASAAASAAVATTQQIVSPYHYAMNGFIDILYLTKENFTKHSMSSIKEKVSETIQEIQDKINKPKFKKLQIKFILIKLAMINRLTEVVIVMLNKQLNIANTEYMDLDMLIEIANDPIMFSLFKSIQTAFILHFGKERAAEVPEMLNDVRYRINMIIELLLIAQNNPLEQITKLKQLSYETLLNAIPKIDFLEEFLLPTSLLHKITIDHNDDSYSINLRHALVLIVYNKLVTERLYEQSQEETTREDRRKASESVEEKAYRERIEELTKEIYETTDDTKIDGILLKLAEVYMRAPHHERTQAPKRKTNIQPITVDELLDEIVREYGYDRRELINNDNLTYREELNRTFKRDMIITDENLLPIVCILANATMYTIGNRFAFNNSMEVYTADPANSGDKFQLGFILDKNIINFNLIIEYFKQDVIQHINRSTKLFLNARILEIIGPARLTCSNDVEQARAQDERAGRMKAVPVEEVKSNIFNPKKGGKKSHTSKKHPKKHPKKHTHKKGKRFTRKLKKNHKTRYGHTKKH